MATVATISQAVMNYGFDSNTWLTRCYDWVREGVEDIVRHVDIPECFSLVTGAVTITGDLTSDQAASQGIQLAVGDVGRLVRVENVFDVSNDNQLNVSERSQVLARVHNGEYGLPDSYSWTSNIEYATSGTWATLSIAPIPSGSVTISAGVMFTPQPILDSLLEVDYPTLVGTGEWGFVTRYRRQVEAYALYRAFQTQDDMPMANYWYDEYLKGRKELSHQYTQSAKQTPRQVPGTWSYPNLA